LVRQWPTPSELSFLTTLLMVMYTAIVIITLKVLLLTKDITFNWEVGKGFMRAHWVT